MSAPTAATGAGSGSGVTLPLSFADARALFDEYVVPFVIHLALALLIFWFGRMVVRMLARGFDRVLERGKVDVSLRKFLGDIVYSAMLVAVAIPSLDMLGVKTTALVAVLGAAGLAIGLALQGALSHFAAGVLLIVLRPYKVGDVVKLGVLAGRVDAIRVFSTVIITPNNHEISIPNAQVIAQPIENYTARGTRRIELVIGIAARAEIADPSATLVRVRALVADALAADARILAAPAPAVDLAGGSDVGFRLIARPWVAAEHYADVVAATIDRLRAALGGAGLVFTIAPA